MPSLTWKGYKIGQVPTISSKLMDVVITLGPDEWKSSGEYYTQEVSVPGMPDTSTPCVFPFETEEDTDAYSKYIEYVDIEREVITFYASETPDVEISVVAKGVIGTKNALDIKGVVLLGDDIEEIEDVKTDSSGNGMIEVKYSEMVSNLYDGTRLIVKNGIAHLFIRGTVQTQISNAWNVIASFSREYAPKSSVFGIAINGNTGAVMPIEIRETGEVNLRPFTVVSVSQILYATLSWVVGE